MQGAIGFAPEQSWTFATSDITFCGEIFKGLFQATFRIQPVCRNGGFLQIFARLTGQLCNFVQSLADQFLYVESLDDLIQPRQLCRRFIGGGGAQAVNAGVPDEDRTRPVIDFMEAHLGQMR